MPPTTSPSLGPPVCPNCGTRLSGPYCSACGQHQRNLDRPFRELAAEALSGFVTFDERLLRTLKLLVRRPGGLTLEYVHGRRASYAHPFRLYFALSVLLFLMLGISGFTVVRVSGDRGTVVTLSDVSTEGSGDDDAPAMPVPTAITVDAPATAGSGATAAEPTGEATRGILGFLLARLDEIYEGDPEGLNRAFTDRLATSVIVLVPAFALLLRLLYRRTRYVTHLVFSVHLHSFAYLVLLVGITIDMILGRGGQSGGPGTGIAQLAIAVHTFLALRRVHRQGRLLTILKMVALLSGYLVPFVVTMMLTLAVTVALA